MFNDFALGMLREAKRVVTIKWSSNRSNSKYGVDIEEKKKCNYFSKTNNFFPFSKFLNSNSNNSFLIDNFSSKRVKIGIEKLFFAKTSMLKFRH